MNTRIGWKKKHDRRSRNLQSLFNVRSSCPRETYNILKKNYDRWKRFFFSFLSAYNKIIKPKVLLRRYTNRRASSFQHSEFTFSDPYITVTPSRVPSFIYYVHIVVYTSAVVTSGCCPRRRKCIIYAYNTLRQTNLTTVNRGRSECAVILWRRNHSLKLKVCFAF